MSDDFNKWREQLRDRIAIQSELDRINAKSVRSDFEEMVEKDIYISAKLIYDKPWRENVELYWTERLINS
jgi:hypothetical protein